MNIKRMGAEFLPVPLALKWVGIIGGAWALITILEALHADALPRKSDLTLKGEKTK